MTRRQIAVLYVAMATSFATTFMGSSLNLSIPTIGKELGVSAGQLGWIVTAYILTVAAFSVPFGRLSDQLGRKKILLLGLMVFAATSLLSVLAKELAYFVFIRSLQGLSGGMIFSVNMPILINNFSFENRGRVLGFATAATYAGLSMGPVLGGVLNHYFGWQSIFWVSFFFTLPVVIVGWFFLPEDSKEFKSVNKKLFDGPGNLYYIVMILAAVYGFTMLADDSFAFFFVLVGLVFFMAFVIRELRTENPLIKVSLFTKNRTFAFSNIAAMLNYGATFAIGYLMSIYLQVIMGYSSQTAGIVLISQPVIMMIVSPISGRLSDKISPGILSSLGMALCAAGLLFFVRVNENTSLAYIIAGLMVTGLGFGVFSSPNTNAVMSSVSKDDHGIASSILATMRSLGHATSMAMVTVIIGVYMGKQALADVSPSLLIFTIQKIYFICIFICLAGIFFSLVRIKPSK